MPGYAQMLFMMGLLDAKEYAEFSDMAYQTVSLMASGQFEKAFWLQDYLIGGDYFSNTVYASHLNSFD